MKKVLLVVLILSFVFSAFGSLTVFAEKNYITNGDFENGKSDWKSSVAEGAECVILEEASGNKALGFKSTGNGIYFYQGDVNLNPNDRVVLSFDLKIVSLDEDSVANISIAYKDINGKTIEPKTSWKFYENIGEWTHYEREIQIPDNGFGLGLLFRISGAGELYYDM